MPYLHVKLCAPRSEDASNRIAAALTNLTAEILRKKRELIAVTLEYVPPELWFIGGAQFMGETLKSFCLEVNITEGTNTKDEKALYVSRVFADIQAIIGPLAPASYVILHDVRADSWGFQGRTQEFRYVQANAL